jgi:predicted GNAT family N-acyltransferase
MVREIATPEERKLAYAIRHQVFVIEQKVPVEEELDVHDEGARHWLGYVQEQPVATARLIPYGQGVGKVGRVAVLSEFRQAGLGKQLMLAMEQAARQEPLRQLVLDAQIQVVDFYQHLGYQAEGELFEDCGILHRRMVKWLA